MQVAGLVDSGMMQVEGLAPSGKNNIYKMPVHIYCFGAPDDGETARLCCFASGCRMWRVETANSRSMLCIPTVHVRCAAA